jgi:hypothetical protein
MNRYGDGETGTNFAVCFHGDICCREADVTNGFIDSTSVSPSVFVLKLALEYEADGDKLVTGVGMSTEPK